MSVGVVVGGGGGGGGRGAWGVRVWDVGMCPTATACRPTLTLTLTPYPIDQTGTQVGVAGGATVTGTGFYGTLNPNGIRLVLLVLLSILSPSLAAPVLFDAGVGLARRVGGWVGLGWVG